MYVYINFFGKILCICIHFNKNLNVFPTISNSLKYLRGKIRRKERVKMAPLYVLCKLSIPDRKNPVIYRYCHIFIK